MDVRIMANAGYGVMVIGEDGLLGWCYQINICAFDNDYKRLILSKDRPNDG